MPSTVVYSNDNRSESRALGEQPTVHFGPCALSELDLDRGPGKLAAGSRCLNSLLPLDKRRSSPLPQTFEHYRLIRLELERSITEQHLERKSHTVAKARKHATVVLSSISRDARLGPVLVAVASADVDGDGEDNDSPKTTHFDGVTSGDEIAVVAPQAIGWFRYYFDERRWEWSEALQRMHGYQAGTVSPTTELVLAHKHPEDRDEVAANLDAITHTRGAFSSRHRIVDARGVVRWVVVVGDQFFDDTGAVIGTHGFYIDVTHSRHHHEDIVTAKVSDIAEKRAPIEHAKGMLMLIYNIDDNLAFELLKWLSQENNVKLNPLARQVISDLRALAPDHIVDRDAFNHTLLTAPHRLSDHGRTD